MLPPWGNAGNIPKRDFTCGHCGKTVASHTGYSCDSYNKIYICPCGKPSYFHLGADLTQIPGTPFGDSVAHLPEELSVLYQEIRDCMQCSAFTLAIMGCRKVLMHIAVQEGARENSTFKEYVSYLESQGFIPPKGKAWIDKIRDKGNEANHEVTIMNRKDAETIMTFTEMLLKFVYEFPAKAAL